MHLSEFVGVKLIRSISSNDDRGHFRKFNLDGLIRDSIESIATSMTFNLGTIRGLHFQVAPFAEEKIISCVQGSIFDVIIDLRLDSDTYKKYSYTELTSTESLQLYLPKGFAHGFQTLESNTIVQYCLTSTYSSNHAFAINPLSQELKISWPISDYSVSERDEYGLSLDEATQVYQQSLKL